MCALIPGAQMHVIDACAHILCAEAPADFNAVLLPFLAARAPAAQTR
jgi:pimeloyl-ACP methyl ester carboxylesterase